MRLKTLHKRKKRKFKKTVILNAVNSHDIKKAFDGMNKSFELLGQRLAKFAETIARANLRSLKVIHLLEDLELNEEYIGDVLGGEIIYE